MGAVATSSCIHHLERRKITLHTHNSITLATPLQINNIVYLLTEIERGEGERGGEREREWGKRERRKRTETTFLDTEVTDCFFIKLSPSLCCTPQIEGRCPFCHLSKSASP